MSPAAIAARGVSKFYGDFAAVRKVDLEVAPGEILALLGRNGAGKTTLLEMLAGLSRPTSGQIRVLGEGDVRRRVGVVGHGLWLYEDLTPVENLEFFGKLYGVADIDRKIDEWLERTDLAKFRSARVREFSRGMRQRLAIARAFLHDPEALLLDEPWTALDDRAIRFLSGLITEARAKGRTIVVCSHQLREALEIATELAVLERGRLVFRGANREAFRASPETFYESLS